ncbi:MAG: hypothetical protein H0V29_06935 [Thermoleophilaceae bacterium]|nr:hypothetical protein [Thermoleophilaceae bacterium]
MRPVLLSFAILLVAAPVAMADAIGDYTQVRQDFQQADGQITPCRYTSAQLENARRVALSSPDLSYTGLVGAIEREIARRCSTTLLGMKIVSVRGKGRGARERVVLRNGGQKTIRLRGTLRNRAGKRLKLSTTSVKRGKRLTVSLGCRKGRRGKRGSRLYACKSGNFFKDRGDVVRLYDLKGRVASQYGYGRLKRQLRF